MAAVLVATGLAGERLHTAHETRGAEREWELRRDLRHAALRTYLDTVAAELLFWGSDAKMHTALQALRAGWEGLEGSREETLNRLYRSDNPHPSELGRLSDAGDGSAYSAAHRAFHPRARGFVEVRGYYDLFLISLTGDVLYSVEKESDFATNLLFGPWQESGLARAFRSSRDSLDDRYVAFSDVERYAPSADTPAIFAATPIRTAGGRRIGVLAMQLPLSRIQEILHFTSGMGRSGETYLVGSDLLMRTNSRFADKSTILEVTVDTPTVARALAGETGVAYTDDYRGVPVLSAFEPLELDGHRWAVMAEIDRAEVLEPIVQARVWFALATLGAFLLACASLWYLRYGT